MYLFLTNAAEQHAGAKIILKKDLVVAAHTATEEKDGVVTTKTYLFVPPHGTWEVSESLEEVLKQLNS
jgi:hypothetical protein